jgi:hypothetical protein
VNTRKSGISNSKGKTQKNFNSRYIEDYGKCENAFNLIMEAVS